ncbi:MAG TPA: alpha/beta fold hydrolase [Symbiobacteriaceae bacterium]
MPMAGHLYYEIHGKGRPLVLLHGHTLDHRMWQPLLPLITPHVQAVLVDLPGHGRSLPSPDGSGPADDLARLLTDLGVDRAAVCGHSMGGAIAVRFALQAPDRCAALIPVGAALDGFPFSSWAGPGPYIRIARSQGLAPALEAWLQDPIFATVMASPAAEQIRTIVRDYPGHAWLNRTNRTVRGTETLSPAQRLGEITAPTLVVVGEKDLPDFHAIAGALATGIPGARKAVVPGAGHMVPVEQPEALASVLLSFLTTLP